MWYCPYHFLFISVVMLSCAKKIVVWHGLSFNYTDIMLKVQWSVLIPSLFYILF